MQPFVRTTDMLRRGAEDGVYPGAVFSTGDRNGERYRFCCGYRTLYPTAEPMTFDTLFDMASLTKILATTMVTLKLIEAGKLALSNRIGDFFDPAPDKSNITLRHLLTHTGGFPAHARLDTMAKHPADVIPLILSMALLYPPGTDVTYSCLGFILLGRICEWAGGQPLDELAKSLVFRPLGLHSTGYRSGSATPSTAGQPNPAETRFAATERDPDTGRFWRGVVHDENARYLNGVSGNAGVFSTLADCVAFAVMLANHGRAEGTEYIPRALFDQSITNHTASLSENRGLGFALSNAALGAMSYGHTGFTGTSLWVDAATGQYAVLLTNRVHPTRANNQLLDYRRALHAVCAEEYANLSPIAT